jgi:hypothetical protein
MDNLEQWARNGWLRPHKPTNSEIRDLMAIVERDLKDARGDLSLDWKFGIAYNAVLKLCTVLLHKSGFRPERNLAHYRTLQALPLILSSYDAKDADYLDACRKHRNTAEYDSVGTISQSEVVELLEFAEELRSRVLQWLELYSR